MTGLSKDILVIVDRSIEGTKDGLAQDEIPDNFVGLSQEAMSELEDEVPRQSPTATTVFLD